MKIAILPDIHGRDFWKQINVDDYDKVVFLGDYLDPYSFEGITMKDAIKNFKEILEFKHNNLDKVILLVGNHDCGYIVPNFPTCRDSNHDEIIPLFLDHFKFFDLCYDVNLNDTHYLLSHAGVHTDWFKSVEKDLNLEENTLTTDLLNQYFKEKNSKLFTRLGDFSYYRGGYMFCGSIVWADIREFGQEKFQDYTQIVGHTQLNSIPYKSSHVTCIDLRKPFILDETLHELY